MLKKLKKFDYRQYVRREVFLLVFASLVGFWVAWNTLFVVLKNNQLQQEIEQLRAEVEVLELENQNLELSIQYYRTDDYLNVEAREGLLLKGEDEQVAVASKTLDAPFLIEAEQKRDAATERKSNPQLWWEFVTGQQTNSH